MWSRATSVADIGYVAGADQAWYRVHTANMHSTVFQCGQLSGMAISIDLRERMRAFERAAAYMALPADHRERLFTDWGRIRAIAVEALTLAIRSFHWGVADTWPIGDLAEVAIGAYPEASRLPTLGESWVCNA